MFLPEKLPFISSPNASLACDLLMHRQLLAMLDITGVSYCHLSNAVTFDLSLQLTVALALRTFICNNN